MPIGTLNRASGRATRRALICLLLITTSLLQACVDPGDASTQTGPPPATTPPPAGSGKVTLNWALPTNNEDGSALTDLAGFRVYYGQSPYALSASVDVAGAASSSVEIAELAAGTWYFAIASYNRVGIESSRSGVVSTTI